MSNTKVIKIVTNPISESVTKIVTLPVPDQRMVELIDTLIIGGTIRSRQEFLNAIGMLKQNYTEVVNGKRAFRVEHISKACREYNVNANWIHGLDEQVFRAKKRVASPTGSGKQAEDQH